MFKNLKPTPNEFNTRRNDVFGYVGGNSLTTNIMANFLSNRNPNLCFIYDPEFNISNPSINSSGFLEQGYKWWIHLTVTIGDAVISPEVDLNNIKKLTQKCLKQNNRFLGFQVFLKYSWKNAAHNNILVYDRVEQTLELFEPHGETFIHNDRAKLAINELLQNTFKNDIGLPIKKYYKPLDFCPFLGVQVLQERGIQSGDLRVNGFCAYWSFWWIELRARNPDISNNVLMELAIDELKNSPVSMTDFIHKFAVFVQRVENKLPRTNITGHNVNAIVNKKLDMFAVSS